MLRVHGPQLPMSQNNTLENEKVQAPVVLTAEEIRWARVLELDVRMTGINEQTKAMIDALKAEYVALLPVATPDQLRKVLDATYSETDLAEPDRPNYLFKLSPDQLALVKAEKARRVAYLSQNKAAHMATVMDDADFNLVSYKIKVGPNKTAVTARFEKATSSKAKAALLAKLAAAKAAAAAAAAQS